jgi:hypothetical protein
MMYIHRERPSYYLLFFVYRSKSYEILQCIWQNFNTISFGVGLKEKTITEVVRQLQYFVRAR